MSDVANLNIVIGANVSQATQGLENVSKSLANTAVSAAKVDSSLLKSGQSSNGAAIALQNLGRVAQDAPFGFIAIQNNLNPLLESFQRLKAESGSSGAALKALGSSLLGPAGLGLALSAVSFILLKFPNLLNGVSEAEAKLIKQQKDFTDAMANASGSFTTEATKLSALIQVARDYSNSTQERKNAIDQLQKLYPGYLSNINLENINSQEAAHAIDTLIDAIDRKSKAQALSNLLTKAQEELYNAQNTKLSDNISTLELLKANYFGLGSTVATAGRAVETAQKNQNKSIAEAQSLVEKYEHALSDLTQTQVKAGDFKLLDPSKTKDSLKTVDEQLKKVAQDLSLAFIPAQDVMNKLVGLNNIPQHGSILPPTGDIKDSKEQLQQIADITKTVQGAFDSLFNSIANGANVFDAIGQALKQLIVKLVATVIEAAILSVILNAIFPGSSAAANGGFSFGKLFGQLSGLPKFAAGGVVTKPTLALVGEQGPERITPLGYENNVSGLNGRVVFEIAGNKLRGVLRREDLNSSFIN